MKMKNKLRNYPLHLTTAYSIVIPKPMIPIAEKSK